MLQRWLLFFILSTFVLTGCSAFQVSSDEMDKYINDFVTIVDQAEQEEENGQKVLWEIREKFEKKEINKIKVQNVLLNGIDITKTMKEDVIKSSVPKDMEPIKEEFIAALDKRLEAYNKLFSYYDLMDEKDRMTGEEILKESLVMFDKVKKDMIPYHK
ncbi:MAG TPA: hypothetical protein VJ824_04500 [Bacillota bacterium]|nr:hypothetical protein [Bacillota bacterium]